VSSNTAADQAVPWSDPLSRYFQSGAFLGIKVNWAVAYGAITINRVVESKEQKYFFIDISYT
jgi:hypothetical protein